MTPKIHPFGRIFVPSMLAVSALLAAAILASAGRAQESVVQLDPAQTKIEFSLRGTMHTVHGTFALKSSAIRFDPSTGKIGGAIVVDATSGDTGNGSRDARMHREILESANFPEITFTPVQIKGVVAAEGASKVEVSGRFRLHGQDHDVTFPVDVKADGKNLELTTHIDIPYIQWGLKNPSNFFLRVSDVVAIEIHAAGLVVSVANP
ncbi:MAG TPA: YceI family protein [Candidatus Acidoferrales bacterium]|jgi:polyisoprenoid-binding protein YceI|nr:YceI family protein [Candidatus Acidoferrales bacterium]